MKLQGWGYEQIGWLLDQVEAQGAAIPLRYRMPQHAITDIDCLERARLQDAIRMARLGAGRCISWAFTWERLHLEHTSDSVARKRKDNTGRIWGQMDRALNALLNDPVLVMMLSDHMPTGSDHDADIHQVLDGMKRTIDALKTLGRELPDTAPIPSDQTKQELLFGCLAKAYRKALGEDPVMGLVKTYENYHGPFVTFVNCAFALAGKPELQSRAMTKALQRTVLKERRDKG